MGPCFFHILLSALLFESWECESTASKAGGIGRTVLSAVSVFSPQPSSVNQRGRIPALNTRWFGFSRRVAHRAPQGRLREVSFARSCYWNHFRVVTCLPTSKTSR